MIEATPVIHVPAALPPTPEKAISATAKVAPKATAAAPTTPPPAVQPTVSAAPKPPAPAPAAAAQPAAPVAAGAIDAATLTASLLAIVSDKTGYPADMLDLSMDMEADLGIDSIKRVEILGALQARHPNLPKVEPQALAELRTLGQIVSYVGVAAGSASTAQPALPAKPAAAPQAVPEVASAEPASDAGALTSSLLAIVSDKTGYPADMLELSMDMEADLGIDSIKRVEILGALQERHPNLPKIQPQALGELRTLGQIVNCLEAEPAAKKA